MRITSQEPWLSRAITPVCGVMLFWGVFVLSGTGLGLWAQTTPETGSSDPKTAFENDLAEAKKSGAAKLFGPQWESTAKRTAQTAQKATNPLESKGLWNQARSQIWFPDPRWPANLGHVFGDPRLRVTENATALSVDPQGKLLAAGLKDGTVLVWEMPSARPLFRLSGLSSEVQALAFHPTGNRLSGGGKDDLILTWAMDDGKVVDRQTGHAEPINSLAYSPDGAIFAAAGADRKIRIHSPLTRTPPREISGPALTIHQVSFSPDGKRIAAASADCKAWVFDVGSGKVLMEQNLFPGGNAYGICFVAEGKNLAVAGANPNQLKLVDSQTGSEVKNLEPFSKPVQFLQSASGGKLVLAGSQDGTMRLVDPLTGQTLRTQQYPDPYRAVALAADGSWFVVAGTDMVLRTRELEHQSTGLKTDAGVGEIWSLAFAKDGLQVLVGGAKGGAVLLNNNGLSRAAVLPGGDGPVSVVAGSPDGRLFAVGGVDRKIRVFSSESAPPQILDGHDGTITALAFGPGGKILASASADRTVKVWDLATGKILQSVVQQVGFALSVAIDQTGGFLAIGGGDGVIRLLDLSGKSSPRLLGGHQGAVTGMAFDPVHPRLASCGNDQRAILWTLGNGPTGQPTLSQIALNGSKGALSAIAFSPSGQSVAAAGADRIIRLWDTPSDSGTGARLERLAFRGHTDWVTTIAFHPTANMILSGSVDGHLRTWDLVARQDDSVQTGHSREVRSLAYDSSGQWLASSGGDGDLIAWPVGTGDKTNTPIRLLGSSEPLNALTWLGAERKVAVVAQNRTLTILDVPSGKVLNSIVDGRPPLEIPVLGYSLSGKSIMAWVPPASMEKIPIPSGRRDQMMQLQDPALGIVRSLALSPDGDHMVAGSDDGTVRVWQTQTGKRIPDGELKAQAEGVADLALSRGNKILATSDKAGRVTLWNLPAKEKLHTLPSPGKDLAALTLKADGTRVLVASGDNRITLFDVTGGTALRTWDLRPSLGQDRSRIKAMAFAPDRSVAAMGLSDGLVMELELP